MAVNPIWKNTAAIGRETTYGTLPSSNVPYYEDGVIHMMPAEVVNLNPIQEMTHSPARTGFREARAYAPVLGNRRVEGNIRGPVMADSIGALLYQLFGQESVSQTADAANPLKSAADLTTSPITGITDPTTSAYLQFNITAYAGSSTSITITGTDANGRTVTETINVTGIGYYESRHSYTSLTSVTATGFSVTSTADINGYIKAEHTGTLADDSVSFAIIDKGSPGRGSGEAGFYAGCVLTQLQLSLDASAGAGLFNYDAQIVGKFPTYDTAPTLYPSVDRPMAGWQASVTKGGVAYYRISQLVLTIANINALLWAADGSQDPRHVIANPFDVQGEMTIIAEDATEFDHYKDGDELDFHITIENSNDALDATTVKSLLLELTRTFFTATAAQDVSGAEALKCSFSTSRDSSDGSLKTTLTNAVHAY